MKTLMLWIVALAALPGSALHIVSISTVILLLNAPPTAAQNATRQILQGPAFEVASIRPSTSAEAGGRMQVQPCSFNASAATVRQLILKAYGVQDFQIVAEPGWVNSERFNLHVHTEIRDLPVYALVLARKDKALGPQIKPSKVDCDAIAEEAQSRGGVPPRMPPGVAPPCSIGFSGRGRMSSRSKPISDLLTLFSQATQRTVIDRTGLKGGWDIDLTWTPNADAFDDPAHPDTGGPSIFTAV